MSLKTLFLPDYLAEDLLDIDWQKLMNGKDRRFLLDIDNTLVLHGSDIADDYAKKVLAEMLKYQPKEVLILSNSSYDRAEKFANSLNLPFVGDAGKPFSVKMRSLKKEGRFESEDFLIGDQLFTDVLAAKYLNLKTILVRPISYKEEGFLLRVKRITEAWIYNLLKDSFAKIPQLPRVPIE